MLPDREVLLKVFSYDPATGRLFWLPRSEEMFVATKARRASTMAKIWNAKHAGKAALESTNGEHFAGRLFGQPALAHRVIWKLLTGSDPVIIDHINGDGRDNRAKNLRSVSIAENCKNRPRNKASTNPYPGVKPYRDRWQATIRSNRKDYYLGIFPDANAAIEARKAAERDHGFHRNHGRNEQGVNGES